MADDIVQKITIQREGADQAASAYKSVGDAADTTATKLNKVGESFNSVGAKIGEAATKLGGLGETWKGLSETIGTVGETIRRRAVRGGHVGSAGGEALGDPGACPWPAHGHASRRGLAGGSVRGGAMNNACGRSDLDAFGNGARQAHTEGCESLEG
jgi:hypothetical protein